MGRKADPYCKRLSELVFEKGVENRCIDFGIPGEGTFSMMHRVDNVLLSLTEKPNVFIALGGTNDLSAHMSAKEIAENMSHVVKTAVKHGVDKVVLLTIPCFPNLNRNGVERFETKRVEANKIICETEMKGVTVIDLASSVDVENKEHWDNDGLHPNKKGYERFAEIIFEKSPSTFC